MKVNLDKTWWCVAYSLAFALLLVAMFSFAVAIVTLLDN